MMPDEYCHDKVAQNGSTLYYSTMFLPEQKRRAIVALLACSRELNDIVNECSDEKVAGVKLQWWREEIDRLFGGVPQHPVTKNLGEVMGRFGLAQNDLLKIVNGVEAELHFAGVMSFDQLLQHCYQVAGPVGWCSGRILGYQDERTLQHSLDLATAIYLTEILRKTRAHARRGVVHLPLEDMEEFRVRPDDLLQNQTPEALKALFQLQVKRIRGQYRKAVQTLPDIDRYGHCSGLITVNIFQALLTEIEKDGFRMLEHELHLTPLRKLWLAWKTAWIEGKRVKRVGKLAAS